MSAADKIQAARALIEPLTGHDDGPWASAHRGTRTDFRKGRDYHRVTTLRDAVDPDAEAVAHVAWRPRREANAALIAAAPALRDTVAALADLADAQAQEIARLREGRIDWEWLDAEITAIPTRYYGDPSHDHDAYWFKTEVLDLIRKAAGWDTDTRAALGDAR